MTALQLDAGARMALDVALGTAGAMGDERCGTEYLLFGAVATASGDMAELCELFALDTARLERAIVAIRGHRFEPVNEGHTDPPMSPRAELALYGKSLSGGDRRSAFDLLLGCLSDPRSGAATVLRHLGVRLGEIRRLVELGAARLDRTEVENLIAALDRRDRTHYSWWGPQADAAVARVGLPNQRPQLVARSQTAELTLDAVVAGPDGFGLTLTVSSLGDWVLPPVWEPIELLSPGVGAEHRLVPEIVTVDLHYADGTHLSNRTSSQRWRSEIPMPGALVRLGTRRVIEDRNDRRRPVRHVESTEWWAWPLPIDGDVRLDVRWAAEAAEGSVDIDGAAIVEQAGKLRSF
ncbi:MAG: Clp protease N-terminal domain-containing protein [Acidimicrobiales bacterium]